MKYDNIHNNISHNPAFNKARSKAEATAKACQSGSKDEKLKQRFQRVYAQRCSKQVAQLLKQADDYIAGSATGFFNEQRIANNARIE